MFKVLHLEFVIIYFISFRIQASELNGVQFCPPPPKF
jgi:hypothetical protein